MRLLGHEDGAHAALADLLQELVRTDHRAEAFAGRGFGRCEGQLALRLLQETADVIVCPHERVYADPQLRISLTDLVEIFGLLALGLALEGLTENRTQLRLQISHETTFFTDALPSMLRLKHRCATDLEIFGNYLAGASSAASPLRNSSYSQERANAQQRSADRRGIPRTLAAFSWVRPAKNRSLTSSAQRKSS